MLPIELQYHLENGKTVDVNNLIDAIYNAGKHPSVHEECLDSQGESCHSDNLGEPPLEASGFYVESVSESEDEEVQSTAEAVLLAKKQLKEKIVSLRVICQSCRNYPASILLLPCAHIACCEYCLMDVRRCPVPNCKKIVRGTKEVFFG
ncbi:hypothetical protein LSH36_623g00030 [Paralvinella palmiformis]|uniref:RING-type domain-containing protein n=1 Tax=Paralvinella palmiformis TaxID=53620 RepID=A0AAD9J4X3_9ANNE|nr:hypothetical protein LSH36_623g00030 [Paralvinella palmiformis]